MKLPDAFHAPGASGERRAEIERALRAGFIAGYRAALESVASMLQEAVEETPGEPHFLDVLDFAGTMREAAKRPPDVEIVPINDGTPRS